MPDSTDFIELMQRNRWIGINLVGTIDFNELEKQYPEDALDKVALSHLPEFSRPPPGITRGRYDLLRAACKRRGMEALARAARG